MKILWRSKKGNVVIAMDDTHWIVADAVTVPEKDGKGKPNKLAGTERLVDQLFYSQCSSALISAAKRVSRKEARTLQEYVQGVSEAAEGLIGALQA